MIVTDASLSVKLVVNEIDSERVRALWRTWTEGRQEIIVPPLFWPECLSAIRRAVYRDLLSRDDGTNAVDQLRAMPIATREPPALYVLAWQLADRLNRPTIYDCCYLAFAELADCEVWTADQRLMNAAGSVFPRLKAV